MTKNYCLLFAFLLFISACFWQCSTEKKVEKNTQVTENENVKKDLSRYPNKDSELALLMRGMYEDTEKVQKAIKEKRLPEDFREKFKKMHSAQATKPEVKDAAFEGMGNHFLDKMNAVYEAKTQKTQIEAFNLMLNACVSCHQVVCPGPIKKIKRLTI